MITRGQQHLDPWRELSQRGKGLDAASEPTDRLELLALLLAPAAETAWIVPSKSANTISKPGSPLMSAMLTELVTATMLSP